MCVSIILEALTRFVEPPEISNPILILFVGSAGLLSNLVGFFVLGGHGHSHGHGDHGHGHGHEHTGHEHTGHSHSHAHDEETGLAGYRDHVDVADDGGRVADVIPEVVVRRATTAGDRTGIDTTDNTRRIRFGDESEDSNKRSSRTSLQSRGRRRSSKTGHSRLASYEDMSIHPASFRQDIISLAASSSGADMASDSEPDELRRCSNDRQGIDEEAPLLKGSQAHNNGTIKRGLCATGTDSKRPRRDSSVHDGHNHTMPKKPSSSGGHGHSHGDMGMNAMILHVIGDALGNLGVIVTALIIWLTDWSGKYYADPAVSLFITAIILNTSIPLTRATSRVLLQATPENISIKEIRQDIERLPGVISCHHIHVWQLSDTKVVASMHLQVSFPIDTHSGEKYMQLAKRARKCLHGFGIHSATIQPEFCLDQLHERRGDQAALALDGGASDGAADGHRNEVCLLDCIDDCEGQGCCSGLEVSSSRGSSTRRASESSHSQNSAPA